MDRNEEIIATSLTEFLEKQNWDWIELLNRLISKNKYDNESDINVLFIHAYGKQYFVSQSSNMNECYSHEGRQDIKPCQACKSFMNDHKIDTFWAAIIKSVNKFYIKYIFNRMDEHVKFNIY